MAEQASKFPLEKFGKQLKAAELAFAELEKPHLLGKVDGLAEDFGAAKAQLVELARYYNQYAARVDQLGASKREASLSLRPAIDTQIAQAAQEAERYLSGRAPRLACALQVLSEAVQAEYIVERAKLNGEDISEMKADARLALDHLDDTPGKGGERSSVDMELEHWQDAVFGEGELNSYRMFMPGNQVMARLSKVPECFHDATMLMLAACSIDTFYDDTMKAFESLQDKQRSKTAR